VGQLIGGDAGTGVLDDHADLAVAVADDGQLDDRVRECVLHRVFQECVHGQAESFGVGPHGRGVKFS
jgi:hypothetical protein